MVNKIDGLRRRCGLVGYGYPVSTEFVRIWDKVEIPNNIEHLPTVVVSANAVGRGGTSLYVPSPYHLQFLREAMKSDILTNVQVDGKPFVGKTYSAEEIIAAVDKYQGGCDDEKNKFLGSLNIERPKKKRYIILEVDQTDYNKDIDQVRNEFAISGDAPKYWERLQDNLVYTLKGVKIYDVRDSV